MFFEDVAIIFGHHIRNYPLPFSDKNLIVEFQSASVYHGSSAAVIFIEYCAVLRFCEVQCFPPNSGVSKPSARRPVVTITFQWNTSFSTGTSMHVDESGLYPLLVCRLDIPELSPITPYSTIVILDKISNSVLDRPRPLKHAVHARRSWNLRATELL